MNLKELFETQIPVGPEHTPLPARIEAGRRALRRRRGYAAGTTSIAAVVTLAVLTMVGNGDLSADRDSSPATASESPTAGPTYTPAPPDEELTSAIPVANWAGCVSGPPSDETSEEEFEPERRCADDMAKYGTEGQLKRRDGVQVSRRVDDPVIDGDAVEASVALELIYDGHTKWYFLEHGEHGGVLVADPVKDEAVAGMSFDTWAKQLGPLTDPGHRYPEMKDAEGVTRVGTAWYDQDGELMIREDAEEIDRVDDPLAYDGRSVALAAEVDGTEWWTLLSGDPGQHWVMEPAGDGDFRDWVDTQVRELYTKPSGFRLTVAENGEIKFEDGLLEVVDQITNPDLDWFTEPGEQSALIMVDSGTGSGQHPMLVRTRNHLFDGAIELVQSPGRRGQEEETLEQVLTRLQNEGL
ncbi:hypothetical protein [Nocardioides speluncae]|uniref:hypothetical protein n=1 Tax=Nocardioides speluncae TaxID=2670337 RepID=UPI000D689473|nr:hypothetical protein [Nocardioides speluncae]